MGQRSVRFPDDLEARAEALAAAEDRSFSYVVVRALEKALSENGTGASMLPSEPARDRVGPAASSRASDLDWKAIATGRAQPKGYTPPRPKGGK